MKAYVIGDIHGCYYTLKNVLNSIQTTLEKEDTIVFLGDYFDRGPHNYKVFCLLNSLQYEGVKLVFLRGNHEQMMLDALNERSKEYLWFSNGGEITSEQFLSKPNIIKPFVKEWIQNLPFAYYNDKLDFYCVHAHLPHTSIDDFNKDEKEDCIWRRAQSIVGKRVFHGHTPHKNFVKVSDNDINLDAGCVFGGGLSYAIVTKNFYGITIVPTDERDKVNF